MVMSVVVVFALLFLALAIELIAQRLKLPHLRALAFYHTPRREE
jgi:hypothetical protein